MRKWTSKAKLVVSERIEADLRKKMGEEYTLAGKQLDLEQDAEAKQQFEERSNQLFEIEIEKTYEEVFKKARFLGKLAVPSVFREAANLKA